jgi:hypothetical protein
LIERDYIPAYLNLIQVIPDIGLNYLHIAFEILAHSLESLLSEEFLEIEREHKLLELRVNSRGI